ncbi:MAG: archaellin/type IV pilin N-terminal domain-containing protein [Nanopusillaceae archaeon]|jgi:flagellin-like protein
MMKRSVSPLIATIILIALTVALGAIIVGWARGYVRGQVSNLGAQLEYLSSSCNSSVQISVGGKPINVTSLNLTVSNTGSVDIYPQSLSVEINTLSGETIKCPYDYHTQNIQYLDCILYNITDISSSSIQYISPGNISIIDIYVNNSVSSLTGATIYILYGGNQIASETINC